LDDQAIHKAIEGGEKENENLKTMERTLDAGKIVLEETAQNVLELEKANAALIEELTVCKNDLKNFETKILEFENATKKVIKKFEIVSTRKNIYKQENVRLTAEVFNLNAQIEALKRQLY
jgi:hypothetical protein